VLLLGSWLCTRCACKLLPECICDVWINHRRLLCCTSLLRASHLSVRKHGIPFAKQRPHTCNKSFAKQRPHTCNKSGKPHTE
jgi:hypothetical protein